MIRCLAGASSSATRTHNPSSAERGMGILSGPSQRERYFNLGPTARASFDGETGFSFWIEPCHPLPRHGKPDTAGVLQRPTVRKSHAVVEHMNIKPVSVPPCRYDDRSARGSTGNPVPDRVLHQWLNEKAGH